MDPGAAAGEGNLVLGLVAVALVTVATLAIGSWGLRLSRTTSDFFVASRSVRPGLNASAISGEYLSGASFLGIAGLVLSNGAEMLWYPVGWTAGYLVLLCLVAAPLRRSGAYTLPDFAEARLRSRGVRRASSLLVVAIGWLYLMPQFQGAGVALETTTGLPPWSGGLAVAVVVLLNVLAGGMRSVTFVQAFQYWLKLTALLVPLVFLVVVWIGDGARSPADPSLLVGGADGLAWADPIDFAGDHPLYSTYSLMVATFLGVMGLPHVVVRYYTNPDGRAARQTTLTVLAMLGLFYVVPPVYGALGRLYAPDLAAGGSDSVVLALPARMVGGLGGDLLVALLTAGAFAAFLATSSGLTVAVAGVLTQDVTAKRLEPVTGFRVAAVVAVVVPFSLAFLARDVGVATVVGLAFAMAAATFCPLLLLGIWWRGLTATGALAGLVVGGALTGAAVLDNLLVDRQSGWLAALVGQPAAWAVPAAFATMVLVSRATRSRVPAHASRFMVRLHTPEHVQLDRD
ncbi:Na+(or H+)/acetate symporter ActP [Nocardioides scoriae]|uniref:Na+(Or H+)/acetate symporter ActP n=1 Tax=Nocardioides scoriae TaxID=642780 RepID=A0A1H1UEN1_9ACTN|nr:cation acetate symporter [Nocardioides scoriae]SDS70761.1 Na+(or H+)/acetate symporter ActP [Nocardioides scoriae]